MSKEGEDRTGGPKEREKTAWSWTVSDANHMIAKTRRIIDIKNEEYWNRVEDLKKAIAANERIQNLMRQQRNQIVSLPDENAVKRYFFCSLCTLIPFPWAPDPQRIFTAEPCSTAVYLCESGHPICRSCYQSSFTCVLSEDDCDYIFGKERLRKEEKLKFEGISKSIRRWGLSRFCTKRRSLFPCAFLTEMIKSAEFSCRNYYNWCGYRGRGLELQQHEATCPCAPKTTSDQNKKMESDNFRGASNQSTSSELGKDEEVIDDDDAKILKIHKHMNSVRISVHNLVWDVMDAYGDELDMNLVPACILRSRHVTAESLTPVPASKDRKEEEDDDEE